MNGYSFFAIILYNEVLATLRLSVKDKGIVTNDVGLVQFAKLAVQFIVGFDARRMVMLGLRCGDRCCP